MSRPVLDPVNQDAAMKEYLGHLSRHVRNQLKRHAAGLCVHAGCNRPLVTKWLCDHHRILNNQYSANYRARNKQRVTVPGGNPESAKKMKETRRNRKSILLWQASALKRRW